MQLLYWYDCI